MMKPFRERNPVAVGAVSLAVILLLVIAAFKASDLPIIGGGDTYHAAFDDASGLKVNDEVRIAGVSVGKVTGIRLNDADDVVVDFKITKDVAFGVDTAAAIKVKTLLGKMFLALNPQGDGQLAKGSTIPIVDGQGRTRTQSAYTVVNAFSGLAERAEQINLPQLTKALNTLADATSTTPEAFKSTLKGVSALSVNLSARDAQIGQLLRSLQTVTGTLANRNQDIVDLMRQSKTLMDALVERRQAIHTLLVSTSELSKQMTALVNQSRADLNPALTNLQGVVNLLLKNQSNIDESLRLMAPFYRYFANLLGNGPWFDTWIQNFPLV